METLSIYSPTAGQSYLIPSDTMTRYIFLPDDKNGKHVLDGKRGTLLTITDPKARIVSPHPILTVKPDVTDYVAPSAK